MNDSMSVIAGLLFGGILGYLSYVLNLIKMREFMEFIGTTVLSIVSFRLTDIIPGFVIPTIACAVVGLIVGQALGLGRSN